MRILALLKILEKNCGCGIFIDLQKPFNAVEHDIMLAEFENYGICGMANNWFKSYLFDEKIFISINCHVSNQTSIK